LTEFVIGKNPCPKCRAKGQDRSGNNFHWYGEGKGGYCHSCEYTIPSDDWLAEHGELKEDEEEYVVGSYFDLEVNEKIKKVTGTDSKGYRGIRSDISRPFGVRYSYSEEDGSVISTYYPTTQDYEISGYKVRKHPKDFTSPVGETGKDCELFGQFKFKTTTGTVLIAGGEHDALAAFSMLSDAQKNKQYDPVACVSPTIGESGAHKQIQKQYAFFSQAKKIVIAMDSDKAGKEAADKIAKVLPRGRVFIMNMRLKDCNQYIVEGREQDFINDFWQAKPYSPAGVHASSGLLNAAIDYSDLSKLTLPPFMAKAQAMFGGGLVKNELTCCFAKTSVGKSLFVDSMVVHWVLTEPDEVVGVLSLEATRDKWATNILSNYLGVRLINMDGPTRREYLSRDDVRDKAEKFLVKEDGSPRFWVCDERGASIDVVKEKILEMIIQLGVTILVADVYSDLMAGLSLEMQEELVAWFKKLIKEYPQVSVLLVCHTRKTDNNSQLTESDIIGTSTIMKSAAQTFSLERDKLSESDFERNCTKVTVHKNRHHSETGPAGVVYFEKETGKLYDLDTYLQEHPEITEF
jgi:hypothetical protein